MPSIDIVRRATVSPTGRVRQLSAVFDVPLTDATELSWRGELPIEGGDWSVGLIVGPSGCGKSTIAREVFGESEPFQWTDAAVIDDLAPSAPLETVTAACQAVGFNTIPAWTRPYGVLSTGEQFRVTLARHMLEGGDPIVVDEFTSVVDRQVAQIGSHAVQKWARRAGRRFVAVTCHYDVIDWLQPDWVLEPATMAFQRRGLQRRPSIAIEIARVDYKAWQMFAPFHYLTRELNKAAACFVLFANGEPASFMGVLHLPHAQVKNIKRRSRSVTLPDWQGLGLAMVLSDTVASAYKALGFRFRAYPAHPSYIRSHDRSKAWAMTKRPGAFSSPQGSRRDSRHSKQWNAESRGGAVFEYIGPAMDDKVAAAGLVAG